jgi:hypothetical protein
MFCSVITIVVFLEPETVGTDPFVLCSASHVVILMVKKYPQFNIVNLDRLDCK